jgi:hypothetical protein
VLGLFYSSRLLRAEAVSRAKAAGTALRIVEALNGAERRVVELFENELGDPVAGVDWVVSSYHHTV